MQYSNRINNIHIAGYYYRKTSSISHTKSQNLNASCILLQLSSLNPLKPGVKGALLKFGNKNCKAEFSSHLKITEYNIYTPLPYQVIKWSLFLKIYT